MNEPMTNAMESFKEVRKATKIKTHVLWISPTFPHDHPRKGEPTYFVEKIKHGVFGMSYLKDENMSKIHTCRADSKNSKKKKGAYEEWKRKIDEVNRGEAILSVRMWSGSAYNRLHDGSHPIEIAQFDKNSGIAVQELRFYPNWMGNIFYDNGDSPNLVMPNELSKNDGLSLEDFKAWFRKVDLSKPIAIIQFTKFRY